MAVVSLDQAKRKLRILHDLQNQDVEEALEQAEAVVFDYIKRPYDAVTDDLDNVLRLAILNMLSHIWDNPAYLQTKAGEADGYLPQNVTMFLHRKRDPALA